MKHFINRNIETLERLDEPYETASEALNNAVVGSHTFFEQTNIKPLIVVKNQKGICVAFTDFEGDFCTCKIDDYGNYIN